MQILGFEYGSKDIQDFVSLFNEGRLNLEPGFQRRSVWSINDRKKLILSICQHYPIPSVFLYRSTDEGGRLTYDVLDGKQRLESILMFQGLGRFRRDRFTIRTKFDENEGFDDWSWKDIQKAGYEHLITGYKIQTVEVSGELTDIIDLFVRINSTGKRLTGQEKRYAKYFSSPFLQQAGKLAEQHARFFRENRIMTSAQLSRMKHIELIGELMASIHNRGPINKKTALDNIIKGNTIEGKGLDRCAREFKSTLNLVRSMYFPQLRSTRFVNSADFYSLFMLTWEMDKNNYILNNSIRNRQSQTLLTWLSDGVGKVRELIKDAKGITQDQEIFAKYLFTTRADTDSSANRNQRAEILRQLLGELFEKKDKKRGFTLEQRRLIWNSDENKSCSVCGVTLTWENFTIDHIKPYSLGGKTSLSNAALMCGKCNSRKGAKYKSRRHYIKDHKVNPHG